MVLNRKRHHGLRGFLGFVVAFSLSWILTMLIVLGAIHFVGWLFFGGHNLFGF